MAESLYRRYIPSIVPRDFNTSPTWLFVFSGAKLLIKIYEDTFSIPTSEDLGERSLEFIKKQYLGELDGKPCYCTEVKGDALAIPSGMVFKDLRSLLGRIEEDLFLLAGRALQVVNWNCMNQYCGKCGERTLPKQNELAKACPQCSSVYYPRISPAIIVAVVRDDKILLAHNKSFRQNWYSVIAGFVEPGETFEDCVKREVLEEVNICVNKVSYFGSQPWPFPDSLMVGFTAQYESGEINVDGEEIDSAAWYTIDTLPQRPNASSIAGQLIEWFVDGQSPKEQSAKADNTHGSLKGIKEL